MKGVISAAFVISALLTAILALPPVSAAANVPQYTPGDRWSYTGDSLAPFTPGMDLGGVEAFVNVTVEVKGLETKMVGTSPRRAVNESINADIRMSNASLELSMSISGYEIRDLETFATLYASVDFSGTYKFIFLFPITIDIQGSASITTTELTRTWSFPLDVGKSGTVTTTSNMSFEFQGNQTMFPDIPPATSTTTVNLQVLRTETVTVRAGSFESYVIEEEVEGMKARLYYAPSVGNYVKSEALDSNGNIYGSVELTSYRYYTSELVLGLHPTQWAIIAAILVVAAAIAIVIYMRRKRLRAVPAQPPTQPPEPPQTPPPP